MRLVSLDPGAEESLLNLISIDLELEPFSGNAPGPRQQFRANHAR
jgi:hypothetical protein